MDTVGRTIIFGGTGFIGTHLTQHFLNENLSQKITLVDILPPRDESYCVRLQDGMRTGQVEFIQWDLRKPIPPSLLPVHADLIFNLAAIHREPGHEAHEYFETNLNGAQNVCDYATAAGCSRMVFTSSISPYGPTEEPRDETSLPVPMTPYGGSKLVAEKMHMGWQAASPERKLLILRPGVVYGPGENGNVTRLVRSLVKGYFVYMGNRETRKAGGYVKELCRVTQFGIEHQDRSGESVTILNFSTNPPATMETFVDSIRKVLGARGTPIALPRFLLLGASYAIETVAGVARIRQPINPVRMRKLFRSTYIAPKRLVELGYTWKYTLEDAFVDWKKDRPEDFLR
jgi:nucleoside-diphosphate-sugar epimerase